MSEQEFPAPFVQAGSDLLNTSMHARPYYEPRLRFGGMQKLKYNIAQFLNLKYNIAQFAIVEVQYRWTCLNLSTISLKLQVRLSFDGKAAPSDHQTNNEQRSNKRTMHGWPWPMADATSSIDVVGSDTDHHYK